MSDLKGEPSTGATQPSSPLHKICIPCVCPNIDECQCLTPKEKENNLFRYHKKEEGEGTCRLAAHREFTESGYFRVEKPTWMYSCHNPFLEGDTNRAQTTKEICDITGRLCACTSSHICLVCSEIINLNTKNIGMEMWMELFDILESCGSGDSFTIK